ncbi:sulfotransferase 1B1-like [Patella vulgata]|uniref:sulfotransferase 1B1-like n=1 Tax=Patella vulgata TaxID=6465 RepID=UPI0024A8EDEF|nr:sulfotransferase 1B1-like [Patella vulgata]XP_055955682.1 sulfotransferase 1B1-like [Patella vulgata]XP_055955683.1 sulfotransferase 1B1-like [Patella vulgata]
MSVVKIPDASGKTVTLLEWEGRLYPNYKHPDIVKNVPSLKLREDDVILCSYPKSGTYWMFEICRMLKNGRVDLEQIPKGKFMAELIPQEDLDQEPSPRVINTHVRFDNLPKDIKTKKPKIVYIRRNPKDVAVSLYNYTIRITPLYEYDGEFKDYLELFTAGKVDYGSWFDYVLDWEKVIRENKELSIFELSYEDLKENPIREIRRLSDFLGVERNEDLIESIKDTCKFEAIQERFKGHIQFLEDRNKAIYRKGEVGDWRNWFSVAVNDWFDEIYKSKMAGSNLKFRFT